MALKIAMVVPPAVDLNTPYAAAPRLVAWLRQLGHEVFPIDMSLEINLRVFSPKGLARMFDAINPADVKNEYRNVYENRDRYIQLVDDAIAVLQQRDMAAVYRITMGSYLPEGPHFRRPDVQASKKNPAAWSHGDLARHLVSVMFADLTELFRSTITRHFGMHRYAHTLGWAPPSFDPLAEELARPPNVYEQMMFELADELFPKDLDLACFTCPFPGNLVGALLLGRWMGTHRPNAKRAFGGGYPSTELRELEEPRVFDYMDYVVIDDGELPLKQICARLEGRTEEPLHNTFVRENGVVRFEKSDLPAIPFKDFPTPDYGGFKLEKYIHMVFRENIVQRASEGTWLKITAAHGCYWKKCTFCDITLPYIADYDPMPAQRLADQMDALHAETGLSGFHFTDEAAPPGLLVDLSLELVRRGRNYHWWGNVRYDRAFEPDRCKLLAAAGMMLVTGGIEVASDAVLEKIVKGISVVQVTKVLQALAEAGIAAHAYLIYGFPGETLQDTVNGLETIRQLMRAGLLVNAVYHQLSATAHAPLGKTPQLFPIRIREQPFQGFARNFLPFEYTDGVRRSRKIHHALGLALDNYRRGLYFDAPLEEWFEGLDVPPTTIAPDFVASTMKLPHPGARDRDRLCWLGGEPTWFRGQLSVRSSRGVMRSFAASQEVADNLRRCHPSHWGDKPPSRRDFATDDWIEQFRAHGLVSV